jgi:hypothetical protein
LKQGQHLELVAEALPKGAEKPAGGVEIREDTAASALDVLIGNKLFTSYHYGPEWVRPFLHPVFGPDDAPLTRAWPVLRDVPGESHDHPHHKSLWVAYGECDKVDNWAEEEGHGWQRHRGFKAVESGPVYGRITARNEWCHADERPQFEETRDMRFYNLSGGARLLDVTVTFHMNRKEVTFRDTKEGGLLSVRVASEMDVPRGGRIENAHGGVNEGETWGKPSPWCDYSGVVGGKHAGIAVFDHEDNPRYPTQWHVRNYGLMTANCFAWSHYRPGSKTKGDLTFRKGSKTTWRYRVYLHEGDASKGRVKARFLDFLHPPTVILK